MTAAEGLSGAEFGHRAVLARGEAEVAQGVSFRVGSRGCLCVAALEADGKCSRAGRGRQPKTAGRIVAPCGSWAERNSRFRVDSRPDGLIIPCALPSPLWKSVRCAWP